MFFLNKYQEIRRLGKGTFGQVYLVQNEKKQQFALKVIPKSYIGQDVYLRQCVDGEIECLKSLNSPHIIKLYDNEQDQKNIYLLNQYCDQGDVYLYMLNHKMNAFSLEKATKILADVVRGLQDLHNAGFLHRDLKPQNILIKTQNNVQVGKLADFGLSKKIQLNTGSFLGTAHFQSPQIFKKQKYGYQVDMWAFGVVFYYMLNGQLLFKQSFDKLLTVKQQQQQLLNEAEEFSFKKKVQNSKFKILWNCNPDTEDLFKRIFELDPQKRITFSEIRNHSVFSIHFPILSKISSKLYNKKQFFSKIVPISEAQESAVISQIVSPYESEYKIYANSQFSAQFQILLRQMDEIYFLNYCVEALYQARQFLEPHHRLMVSYNIKKYALILLRNYKQSLNKKVLAQNHPTLEWSQLTSGKLFKQYKNTVKSYLARNQIELVSLHDQCLLFVEQINKANKHFLKAFEFYVQQTELNEDFKVSYRYSASIVYSVISAMFKQRQLNDNQTQLLLFLLALLVTCHSFNLLNNTEHLLIIFVQYFQQPAKSVDKFMFMEFAYWLKKAQTKTLNKIVLAIMKMYFLRN